MVLLAPEEDVVLLPLDDPVPDDEPPDVPPVVPAVVPALPEPELPDDPDVGPLDDVAEELDFVESSSTVFFFANTTD